VRHQLTKATFLDLKVGLRLLLEARSGPAGRLKSAPSIDMSLNKTTRLEGRARLQLRGLLPVQQVPLFPAELNNTRDQNFGNIIKANIGDGATWASHGRSSSG
jgi:hypothetical protein